MIDMAEAEKNEEKKSKTKKDEVTGDTLVWDSNALKADGTRGDYVQKTISPELYRQQKAAQTRRTAIAGATGLAAEGLQFAIGQSVFSDPSVRAAQADKARLAAQLKKGPDYLSEAEKSERRQAALAPVERRAEALQRRSEAIAASTGDVSVRSLLASGEAGIAQMRQQALETEAGIAQEDLTRQQLKEQQDEKSRQGIAEVDAMMLELRNKYIREPLHKFIADAGKVAGTMMAYAPARSIDEQVAELRKQNVSEEEISKFIKLAKRRGPRRVEKLFNEALGTLPAATEADNEKLEMTRQMEAAGEAVAATRGESPEASNEVKEEAEEDTEAGVFDPDVELSEEDAREMAGLGPPETEGLSEEQKEFGRRINADGKKQEEKRSKALNAYTKTTEIPELGPLYNKGKFFYAFKDGVWTVYGNQASYMFGRPLEKNGEPVQFSIDRARSSDYGPVRELYDLAVAEGLAT